RRGGDGGIVCFAKAWMEFAQALAGPGIAGGAIPQQTLGVALQPGEIGARGQWLDGHANLLVTPAVRIVPGKESSLAFHAHRAGWAKPFPRTGSAPQREAEIRMAQRGWQA